MRLRASEHVVALGHMGAVYLYHQRYGYILEMSGDVHDLFAAFAGGADRGGVEALFGPRLTGQSATELVDILTEFSCLVEAGAADDDKWIDYVPVKGAWNVWERSDEGVVTLWTAWGERDLASHSLSNGETAIWDAIDGELRVAELAARFGVELTLPLIARLTSIEIQAVKLSPMPLSVFGGRHKWPAYLTSTMPYPPLGKEAPSAPALADYHADIDDADAQFDDVETTLAHLFRRPHPALGDRTYGAALLDGLERHGLALRPEPLRVVEIGGGLGEVAASFVSAARVRNYHLDYTIVELSPALARRQRARTEGLGVNVTCADALAAPIDDGSVDLLIANEMIGDLATAPLADAGDTVKRFELDVDGATAETPINTGAIALVEKAWQWMAPGGVAILTEFGDRSQFARLSSHLDHPEHSIHFGHLEQAAIVLGFKVEYLFVMDLLEMRRDLEGLATTRSQFRALRGLLGSHDVTLEKVGYTAEMFAALTASVDVAFGDLRFEKIEDRLMGLVPHEFKALILRRP